MSVYVAVAEEQGFASAARRLNMSPPAVTRAIAALEEHVKVKLLNRTTRYVRTTEAGQRYLDDTRRILAHVDAADEAAAGINAEPKGHLTITAPVLFGHTFVMPGIVKYLEQYPETDIAAQFMDRNVNLLEEGVDVGIRIGELPDSSMRALRVGSVRLVLCASPIYFKKHGLPQNPEELLTHTIIASSAGNNAVDWRFNTLKNSKRQKEKTLRIKPRLTTTTNDSAIDAAVRGFGITRLLSYQIAPQLASGELKIFLNEYEPVPRPIHIVHREGRYTSTRVRAFIDLMAKELRSNPSLN
jgi:DNA-binding transcriptional LysR family regulator